jgi:hypothetical protein
MVAQILGADQERDQSMVKQTIPLSRLSMVF